jgi:hypothetical protein
MQTLYKTPTKYNHNLEQNKPLNMNKLVGKVIKGNNLKYYTKTSTFYKIFQEDLYHNGMQYQMGINTNHNIVKNKMQEVPFNPKGRCQSGGLYFTTLEHISNYLIYGTIVGTIEIDNDEDVYVEKNQFKCHSFNVTSLRPFDEKWCMASVKQNGFALSFMEESMKSYPVCYAAVQNKGRALAYVPDVMRTRELCFTALSQNRNVLEYVPKHVRTQELLGMSC